MVEQRAIFLFDGPNFYKNLKHSKLVRGTLDFSKLATELAGPRKIVEVMFFTSPTDRENEPINYANQQKFFVALTESGVSLALGKLVNRGKKCPLCEREFSFKTEKSVDVQIALALALGAAEDKWDVAYLASCDSDLIPAIEYVQSKGKKVFLIFPDGSKCYSVGEACDASIPIKQDKIDRCQAY